MSAEIDTGLAPERLHYRSPQITVTNRYVTVDGNRIALADLLPMYRSLPPRSPLLRVGPRRLEIYGTYRNRRVLLYRTDDQREYGRVWRALVRAVENNRDLTI